MQVRGQTLPTTQRLRVSPFSRPSTISRSLASKASCSGSVSIEEGKKMLDRGACRFLDIRSRRDYEREHLTKPPRSVLSAPLDEGDSAFLAQVSSQCPNKAAGLLVACADGGSSSQRAMQLLSQAGYSGAMLVEGGYDAWTQVFSTSGRRKPPPGRWVSTGKEALKSGLNIPGVAESYDEGGNLSSARYARGLADNEALPPSSSPY